VSWDSDALRIPATAYAQTLALIAYGQMIQITQRPINDSEKKILLGQIPSRGERIEKATMAFIFILFVFLGPLLLIDRYWIDVSPRVELISLFPILTITTLLTYRLDKKMFDSKYIKADIEVGTVTVYNVTTDKVVKRKDPEDFGPSYYFDLGQGSEFKTLFLFGQYLMDFKRKTFPSTEFQVIKANSGQVIDVIPTGGYLKPVKTLKAYSKEDFKKGKVPDDGQLLSISIDEIVE